MTGIYFKPIFGGMLMKHNRWLALFLLVGVLLLSTLACAVGGKQLTAQEVLNESSQKGQEIKTAKMEMTINMKMQGMSLAMTANGVIEAPDKVYMTMNAAGQNIEILVLSKDEMYMKMPGADSWTPVPADQMGQTGMNTDILSQLKLGDIAQNPKLEAEEKVDGVDCYHVSFEIDMAKYMENFGQSMEGMIDPSQPTVNVQMWVGKSDLLVRKLTMGLKLNVQGAAAEADYVILMKDYNQPVEIPTP
jgi:outer membrane lipoprotein-sorting protein